MSRIKDAFAKDKAFIPFITAGDPNLDKTADFILALEKAGADLIEIGIPFSDPVAEGAVIQEADLRALNAGTTIEKIFEMITSVRQKTNLPLVFMTYLNPVFHYGYDAFFAKCQTCDIAGVIIHDIPYEEKQEVVEVADQYEIDVISFIAPTSKERIQMIAREAKGFIYVVSSLGVTGVRSEITTDLETIIAKIKEVTDVPTAVGFGINTPEQATAVAEFADGVIVGSAIVKLIAQFGESADEHIYKYAKEMKSAIS